ncbi:MAG: acyl-CoA dehydrogenase family protein [Dehalococcoidia bacterium]
MTTSNPKQVSARDILALDALLDEEELLLRETVRRYTAENVLPNIAEWFEHATLPKEVATELGSLGLLGMHLDGYGCPGGSSVQYGIAAMELEAGDTGLRSFVSVQGSLVMFPLHSFGSEEQKQRWLPVLATGEAIGCFGLTEPDSGSDPSSMRTIAKRDGRDWVLNGTKLWITNGTIADVAIIWARTEDGPVRGFVVPTDTPGFTANEIKQKLSLRASRTAELVLEDVRLPEDAVLPGVEGMRGPLSCLNEARYGIVWGTAGAARDCYERALAYASERTQFGRPIAGFQLTQQKLVDMMVKANMAGLLALHIGRKKDSGTLEFAQISFGKMHNARIALENARTARSVMGANGITHEYHVMRHMANLESVITYEGTNEIHTLILGQTITGASAFH